MILSPSPHSTQAIIAGRYRVLRKLGSGSLGTVYLVLDEAERREVALKLLRTEALITRSRAGIQEEFRAIAALDHPQIARAFDFGYTDRDGIPFYTREHIAGHPLLPGSPDEQPPGEFLRPVLDLLDALEYVHDQGILHLDIHAGNLIVADDPRRGSVLIDFGLAPATSVRARSSSAALWPSLPPELIAGSPTPSPATDLYLVGRLLLHRITGRTAGEPTLPREIPGWGARRTLEIERILHKALGEAPAKRFGSAAELRAALTRAIGGPSKRLHGSLPKRTLLGREEEISAIDSALESALEGSPSELRLTGPAGFGKSALLAEARLRAQLRGLETVTVRFPSDPGPALPRAVRRLGRKRPGLISWLGPLAPRCGGTPKERAERAAAAYFLEPGKPIAFLLDDIDRADRESLLLIHALSKECESRRSAGARGRGLALVLSGAGKPERHPDGACIRTLRGLPGPVAKELFLLLTRPLPLPPALVRSAVASARGSPLLVQELAGLARESWRKNKILPSAIEISGAALERRGWIDSRRLSADDRGVLAALAVLGRAAGLEELVLATQSASPRVARSLRRLASLHAVSHRGRGPSRSFHLDAAETAEDLAREVPRSVALGIHERLAARLSRRAQPTAVDLENLALHLLALERWDEAAARAIEAAHRLRASGSRDRAVSLLHKALSRARRNDDHMELAELLSDLLDELGDHERGIQILKPVFEEHEGRLSRAQRVRVGRRLGVHFHRAGLPEKALAVFEAVRPHVSPESDLEDLIRIESEVAELEIFRGNLSSAEEACREGLAHIQGSPARTEFLENMEVMLRASLGHLELRRFRFEKAQEELRRALALARRRGTLTDRAAILQNLGVASNESNDLEGARRVFQEAARLLRKAGDLQDLIKVSNNLALISAKIGDAGRAERHLEEATGLLRQFPVRRLECFTAYSSGLVRLLSGNSEEALVSLEEAMSRSHRLGDATMEAFAAVFASEAALLEGRYGKARTFLAKAARIDRGGLAVLKRMIASRLYLIEAVLGRVKLARSALQSLEDTPRSDVEYLETWNDLFLAMGRLAGRQRATHIFEGCEKAFRMFGVVPAERLARLGLLLDAIAGEKTDRISELSRSISRSGDTMNRFLQVVEPLTLAEGSFILKETDAARTHLAAASRAIIGSPFVEADWRLELLRASLAAGTGDVAESRRHLHRALHCRNLLVELVPDKARRSFLDHPRFDGLRRAEETLGSTAPPASSTERLGASKGFEGILGRSPGMVSLHQVIERLRDQSISVLISGETGTGKDLVARALHARSSRRSKPFQVVHCASLPPELFESELCGHVAGAFTGAERDHIGILEAAQGGTLLLDDVHLLPPGSQAKLVTVAQAMSMRKLGSSTSTPIDVRFLATTTVDLRTLVPEGRFHQGLFFRLAGMILEVPPLRDRPGDVDLLARHFLERHSLRVDRPVPVLEEAALAILERYPWPGNVRELESVLLRAVITPSRSDRITASDLEHLLEERTAQRIPTGKPLLTRGLEEWRRDLERSYLTELLLEKRGDVLAAAKLLGVRRSKLYSWCRRLGIDVRELRRRGELE